MVSVPLQSVGIKLAAVLAGTETLGCVAWAAFLRQLGVFLRFYLRRCVVCDKQQIWE